LRKGLLLRVGIDLGSDTGGDLGPIFQDGRFEYIPILGWPHVETEKYCEHQSRESNRKFGSHWSDFLREDLGEQKFHFDPIFDDSWTYGECPTKPEKRCKNCLPTPKMRALMELQEDDLLVFTAGLKNWPETQNSPHHVYIIGYLQVREKIPFFALNENKTNEYIQKYKRQLVKNAHVIEQEQYPESKSLESSVVVIGKEYPKSRLLTRAIKISEFDKDSAERRLRVVGKQVLGYDGKTRDWTEILGFSGSIQRSVPRRIKPPYIGTLEKELETVY